MSDTSPYLGIPGENSRALQARRQQVVARGVSSTMNVFAARADGATIEDVDGNHFIDFAGGIGVMNIGHSRPEVVQAIAEQAAKFTHTCFSVMMYEPYIELAERIIQLVPGNFPKKAIFFNSGAEAVENAVKIARYATGRPAIIVFDNAYHGRTLLTMSMTAKVKPYKYRFGPYAPEVYRAPFPYPYRMDMTPSQATDACITELKRMFVGEVAPDQVGCDRRRAGAGRRRLYASPSRIFKGAQGALRGAWYPLCGRRNSIGLLSHRSDVRGQPRRC